MLATWRWRRTLQPNLQGSVQRWVQPTAFTQPQPSCQTEGVFLNFELDTQGEKHHWSLHRSFIDPSLIPSSILHRPFISPRPPQDRPKTTQRPRQDRPLKKYRFFIKNIDFSLEKCRFGAKKSVSHYVLRRKREIFQKNTNFELEICVKSKKGCTALQPEASLSPIC